VHSRAPAALWRQVCLQRFGRDAAVALFAEREREFAAVHAQLDMLAELAPGRS
jgi:hypothetical protein